MEQCKTFDDIIKYCLDARRAGLMPENMTPKFSFEQDERVEIHKYLLAYDVDHDYIQPKDNKDDNDKGHYVVRTLGFTFILE